METTISRTSWKSKSDWSVFSGFCTVINDTSKINTMAEVFSKEERKLLLLVMEERMGIMGLAGRDRAACKLESVVLGSLVMQNLYGFRSKTWRN